MAFLSEEFLQFSVILDDAVVHKGNGLGAVHVGVGILIRDAAVRAPAAMGQSYCSLVP